MTDYGSKAPAQRLAGRDAAAPYSHHYAAGGLVSITSP